jgi:HK97 family phage major capsid protein
MATEMIKHLIEQRLHAWDQAKDLLERVEREQRDLTGEENDSYKKMQTDIDEFGARIKDLEQIEVRRKDMDEQRAGFELAIKSEKPEPQNREQRLNEKILSFMRGGLPGAEYAPRSVEFKITDADKKLIQEKRDLSKLTNAAGAYTVPTGFVSNLYEHMVEVSSVRQSGAIVYTTDSGEALLVPKTLTHNAAALLAEAAGIPESDGTFGQQTLLAYKYGVLIEVSNELITDSGIDLLGYLARSSGRALGIASGIHFVTGTGTAQPEGVQTNVTVGKQGIAGQTLTVIADDLFDVYHSIISFYRSSGVWMMNDASLAKIRKLKDSTNQYLWQPGLQQGVPDSLLGRPVLTDPTIPVMGVSVKSILFGDFSSYYAIRDVSGVRFERSDDFRFANDLVAFRALLRTDGKPMDLTAVKAYQNSAT